MTEIELCDGDVLQGVVVRADRSPVELPVRTTTGLYGNSTLTGMVQSGRPTTSSTNGYSARSTCQDSPVIEPPSRPPPTRRPREGRPCGRRRCGPRVDWTAAHAQLHLTGRYLDGTGSGGRGAVHRVMHAPSDADRALVDQVTAHDDEPYRYPMVVRDLHAVRAAHHQAADTGQPPELAAALAHAADRITLHHQTFPTSQIPTKFVPTTREALMNYLRSGPAVALKGF